MTRLYNLFIFFIYSFPHPSRHRSFFHPAQQGWLNTSCQWCHRWTPQVSIKPGSPSSMEPHGTMGTIWNSRVSLGIKLTDFRFTCLICELLPWHDAGYFWYLFPLGTLILKHADMSHQMCVPSTTNLMHPAYIMLPSFTKWSKTHYTYTCQRHTEISSTPGLSETPRRRKALGLWKSWRQGTKVAGAKPGKKTTR